MNKILLVGELNPYGADPKFALYPLPEHASGARLKGILGLSLADYLKGHDRVNLCTGTWSMPLAVAVACAIHAARPDGTGIVLCGVKVAGAFRRASAHGPGQFTAFSLEQHETIHYLTLPHPSGRNLIWNDRDNWVRARVLYDELRRAVGYELSVPRLAVSTPKVLR